jgi:hypothetical protein
MNKQEKENLNGLKFILPDLGIHPDGINVCRYSPDISVLILRQRRRTSERQTLNSELSHLSVHEQKRHYA